MYARPVLALALLAGPALAADDPLALIPPKAIATVQVNGLQRVQDRLDVLLKAAAPDRAGQASKAVRDAINEALAGRDTRALKPDGRILVAIADVEKLPDDATLTFLFPVTSGDDFRKRFLTDEERKTLKKDGDLESVQWEDRKEPFYLANIDGHVVVTSDKATATAYARGTIGGVAKHLSADSARTFLNADVGLFVNVREVNAKYGDQLKRFKSVAELFLKGDTVQGVNKAQLEQLKSALGAAFQVIEHGTAAVLAAEFRPDGLAVRGLAQFADGTPTAAALAKSKPTPLPQLGGLPAGQMAYTAGTLDVFGGAVTTDTSLVDDPDPAAKEAIDKLKAQVAGLDRGVTATAGRMGGPTLEVTESKDAAGLAAARVGMFRALTKDGTVSGVPLRERPEVTDKAERLGPFALTRVALRFDLDKAVADLPEDQREGMRAASRRALGGGDALTVWVGTDGTRVLYLTAREWAAAKALGEAYLAGATRLDRDPAYQSTRKQLPADATMLVLLEAGQTASSLFGMLRDTGAVAAPGPKAEGKAAFIGIAVVLRPGHGGFELFVPATAVDPVRKLVEPLLDEK